MHLCLRKRLPSEEVILDCHARHVRIALHTSLFEVLIPEMSFFGFRQSASSDPTQTAVVLLIRLQSKITFLSKAWEIETREAIELAETVESQIARPRIFSPLICSECYLVRYLFNNQLSSDWHHTPRKQDLLALSSLHNIMHALIVMFEGS